MSTITDGNVAGAENSRLELPAGSMADTEKLYVPAASVWAVLSNDQLPAPVVRMLLERIAAPSRKVTVLFASDVPPIINRWSAVISSVRLPNVHGVGGSEASGAHVSSVTFVTRGAGGVVSIVTGSLG